MNYFYLIAGILVFTIALCDLAYTTFSSNGAGYLTNAITKGMWRTSLRICRHDGTKNLLEYVGISTIGVVVITWFMLIWMGSTLIIISEPASVIDSSTNQKTTSIEKMYYTGYTLSTLGNGDYKASTNFWRLFTVILSLSGFMLITTAVTYMLPVLTAEVAKRKISKKIFLLGMNPQEFLLNNYHNGTFKHLETYFSDWIDMIVTHSKGLLAYPILYSFHISHIEKSSAVSIAVLDEALTILMLHVPEENRPSNIAIAPLRKAIAVLLNTLDNNFTHHSQTEITLPAIERLQAANIPLINCTGDRKMLYEKHSSRRKLLAVMLRNEGWKFSDIDSVKKDPEQET